MHLHILFVALTVLVVTETQNLEICQSLGHPCGYRIGRGNTTILCRCPQGQCPTDWSNRDRVITIHRYLPSGYIMKAHKYMFCDDVLPQRICTTGSGDAVPIQMEYANESLTSAKITRAQCRCRGASMAIKMRTGVGNYSEHLVCYSMLGNCGFEDPCRVRTIRRDTNNSLIEHTTVSLCQCTAGFTVPAWNERRRIVSLNLTSETGGTVFRKYMFGYDIYGDNGQCTSESEAVTFKYINGSYLSPKLVRARCYCAILLMMIVQRERWADGDLYQNYTCNRHVRCIYLKC